jgi:hypothetical protein
MYTQQEGCKPGDPGKLSLQCSVCMSVREDDGPSQVSTPPQERAIFTDDTTWTDHLRTFVDDIDRKARACKRIVGCASGGPYGDAALVASPANSLVSPGVAWDTLIDKLDNIHNHLFQMHDSVVRTMRGDYPFLFLANLVITGIFPMTRIYARLHATADDTEFILSRSGEGSQKVSLTCRSSRSPAEWRAVNRFNFSCPVRLVVAACPTFDTSSPKTRRASDGRMLYTYSASFDDHQVSNAFQRIAERWPCTIHMCTANGAVKAAFRGAGDGRLVSVDSKTGSDGPPLYT